MKCYTSSQRGFSAIMSVVLIVLLALMGGYMATLTSVSSINSTVSAGTMQAWFAARSGVEWAVQQVLGAGACITSPTTFNLNGGGTDGYTVILTCQLSVHTETGIGTYNVYALTSRASKANPGSPAYVARQINISVTDAP